ncbi:hypothetical protein LJC22_07805, partial [Desulfosarcina sp. OttesenSCG-928-G10]|nr:hypothetical protein [Desulfosarcina sp. OttesenSCG-928-G10]
IHHPWVETATVSREIPSRLDIRIQEEVPLALLEITGDDGFLVNRAGRIFKRAEAQDQHFRPRVTGLGYGELPVPGFPDTPAFKTVMELLRLFSETGPPLFAGIPVHHIRMDPQIGATVYLGEGERTLLLGFGPYSEKRAVLSALLDQMQADSRIVNYQCIDLYDVNRIVVTPVPVELTRSVSEEVNSAGT